VYAAIGFVLLGIAGTSFGAPALSKNVLVIHEGAIQSPLNTAATSELEQALAADRDVTVQLFHEYLDNWRLTPDTRQIADTLRQKYWLPGKPDVIIAVGTTAVRLMSDYSVTHFGGAPVVFLLNSDRFADPDELPSNMTGISVHFDIAGTIRLALRLHPGTRQVFFVGGSSQIEQAYKDMFRSEAGPLLNGVDVTYLDGLPVGELLTRLGQLPEHSLVYHHFLLKDTAGNSYNASQIAALTAAASNMPTYTSHAPLLGSGAVGGSFYSIERDARRAARFTLRILKGGRPQDIPRESTHYLTAVDWRQLQRWHIPESRLPRGVSVLFREPTVWERYKWRIVSATAVCLLQTILIGGLLIERKRRRKSNEALGRAEGARWESEERFRNMADTAPVMIWVSGPDKLCTFFNKGWLDFAGRAMEQELGQGWAEGVHPNDLERCYATYVSAFDARRNFQMEYRLRRADGEYRWVLDNGVPRFQYDGAFAGYVGSCIDITDVKRTQEEALAGQKLESLGLLASGIAHDFNNVLGGILASTEVAVEDLRDGESPEEELLRIRNAAIGGAEIVRQLMIYAGKGGPDCEPVDLSPLVGEMLQVLKLSISKRVIIKTTLGSDLPMVQANRAQIRQVVMNLVINASQAIGERDGEIRVGTALATATSTIDAPDLAEGEYVQLEVSDTGSGMTEATRVKIFDPFFSTKATGRGLGLAVVQGIVRAHGGAINLASTPGQGTTFQVLLPCMRAAEGEVHGSMAAAVGFNAHLPRGGSE
jgi:PAS domain S-box-containing protein